MNVPETKPVPPKPPVKYLRVLAAVAALGAGLSIWLGIQETIEVPTMVGKPVEEARAAPPQLAKTTPTEEQRLDEVERKNVAGEEQERQITTLIGKARKALAAVRLTRPKEYSAVMTYAQQALQLAPEHAGARQLIADVMEVIIIHGREALHKGDLAQAKTYQDEAAALADRYHLPDAQIIDLTREIELEDQRPAGLARKKAEKERLADEPPQKTGQSDMAAQMKKLEERHKELARREEELRKQQEAAMAARIRMKKLEEREQKLARQNELERLSLLRQKTTQSDTAAQMKKLEERQQESARREEQLRKQKEEARLSPPPQQVFIPPSF